MTKARGAQAIDWQSRRAALAGLLIRSAKAPRPLHVDPGSRDEHPAVAALRQAEQNITTAYQRGSKEGEAAANQKMAAQVQAKIEQLSRAIEQLAAASPSRSSAGSRAGAWCASALVIARAASCAGN